MITVFKKLIKIGQRVLWGVQWRIAINRLWKLTNFTDTRFVSSISDFPTPDEDGDIILDENVLRRLKFWIKGNKIKLKLDWENITAFADAWGGEVTITSANHGLKTWREIKIGNSTNYNWIYEITKVDNDSYKITATWVATETRTTEYICRFYGGNYVHGIYGYNFSSEIEYEGTYSAYHWTGWVTAEWFTAWVSWQAPNWQVFDTTAVTPWQTIDFWWTTFIFLSKSAGYLWDASFLNIDWKMVIAWAWEGFELKNNANDEIEAISFAPFLANTGSSCIKIWAWWNVWFMTVSGIKSKPRTGESFFDVASWVVDQLAINWPIHSKTTWWDFWKSWGADEKSAEINVSGATWTPNSQIIGSLYMERNAVATVISNTGETWSITAIADGETTGSITAFADYSGTVAWTVKVTTSGSHGLTTWDEIEHTLTTNYNGTFIITVIDATNYYFTHSWDWDDATWTWTSYKSTVTSSLAHWLSNGDIVWIIDDYYTGKYTITNVTTDTFDIEKLFWTTATWVRETYWEKIAWITLPMENQRASMTDNNEITFSNTEEKTVVVQVSYNVKGVSPSATNFEFSIFKNNQRLKGTLRAREMTDKLWEGHMLCTTTVVSWDVFEVYWRNVSTATNLVVQNMSVEIS